MAIQYTYPPYEVIRNDRRCISCRICEQQCANEVHRLDPKSGLMESDDSKCVNCHRCVSLCPKHALKITKTSHAFRENCSWSESDIREAYLQAESGGVLLSSMGNPNPFPVYWDKMLINASQVTNPSIDPLREPMETRVYLGNKPRNIERGADGGLIDNLPGDACVEVPCLVNARGVLPCHVGRLPVQLAAMNQTNINVQLLTIEAARTRKREHIYQAAMLDPHTAAELSIDDIRSMCDELIEAHGSYMAMYR